MIPNRIRGSRRSKAVKLPKNLKRLYIEGKCRECAVVITRMDFAKILGKFTKVKIQYESSTTPKTNQNSQTTSSKSTSRLKSNENGMVQIRRNAYNQHPVKEVTGIKKIKTESPRTTPNILKENNRLKKSVVRDRISNNNNCNNLVKKNNISLKEYGIVFQDPLVHMHNNINDVSSKFSLTDLISQVNDSILPSEDWCIDFFPKKGEPKDDKVYDRIAAELEDLMYNEKPTKCNEKPNMIETKVEDFPSIMDILNDNTRDIKTNDQSSCLEFKSNLESSDVEAMLLGKPDPTSDPIQPEPMEVDNSDVGNLIEDVNQLTVIHDNGILDSTNKLPAVIKAEEIENPQSPSILDEALQKGIEEHLPSNPVKAEEESALVKDDVKPFVNDKKFTETNLDDENKVTKTQIEKKDELESKEMEIEQPEPLQTELQQTELQQTECQQIEQPKTELKQSELQETEHQESEQQQTEHQLEVQQTEMQTTEVQTTEIPPIEVQQPEIQQTEIQQTEVKRICSFASVEGITHLVFKKTKDGTCYKTVTCPKNLKYEIEINGKSVEFIGAPKFISSLEDLQVLLQIANESELDSLYVLH